MTAQRISEALTGAEARTVARAFLEALERFDVTEDRPALVDDLRRTVGLAQRLADGVSA